MIEEELGILIEQNSTLKVNREVSARIIDGFNRLFVIQGLSNMYVLRLSNSIKPVVTTVDDYLFEMNLLNYLNNNYMSVAQPLKWNNNSYLLSATINKELYYCFLFHFIEGKILDWSDSPKYFTLGKFIGILNSKMASFSSLYKRYTWDFEKAFDFPLNQFKDYVSESLPHEYTELIALIDWLKH